jgi:dihydrolipoamide dehydrogenase
VAIRGRVPLEVMDDTIQPFPTFSEIYLETLTQLTAAARQERSGPLSHAA